MNFHLENLSLAEQITSLQPLVESLERESNKLKKIKILDAIPAVQDYLANHKYLKSFLLQMPLEGRLAVKSVLALGQGPIVFQSLEKNSLSSKQFHELLEALIAIENFYDTIGGIVGYHFIVLKLILKEESSSNEQPKDIRYLEPQGLDLTQDTPEVRRAVRWGIEHFSQLAQIYPVGGAGDRLDLRDEKTGEPLPAAELLFCGRTLLDGLLRDLQGSEYLNYKCYGKHVVTPIAMMTSNEKNNHQHILDICEQQKWFGRPKDSFRFFMQPLVPMITIKGNWSMCAPFNLTLKPGGHGVIWKVAEDNHIFSWLASHKRKKAVVRQINNPVAGIDHGILALIGLGIHLDKSFGFASCYRLLNTAEGVNVLVEAQKEQGFSYCISNIEYTDFKHKGIKDVSAELGGVYSKFPSNTNILFIDLKAVQEAIKICPVPGMLVNMKKTVATLDVEGKVDYTPAARLESTMQNIADYIVDTFDHRLRESHYHDLKTFLTYNERRKTISVTKKSYNVGQIFLETPEGSFFELLQNQYDLLKNYCGMQVPPSASEEEYLVKGPSFLALYHPALGPLYSVIAQKIRKGSLTLGSEMYLEIAELEMNNLDLDGSLQILADDVMGSLNFDGIIHYNVESGKCILNNVKVVNKGIDRNANNLFWKYQIKRNESLTIILRGNAEFVAENIVFLGNHYIEVPNGSSL